VLASERSRNLRYDATVRAGRRCERCGVPTLRLDAHHARGYARLGRERLQDLVMLCRLCHDAVHNGQRLRPMPENDHVGRRVWLLMLAVVMASGLLVAVLTALR
jgi:predicted HNH restriction endonuclease